VVLAVPVFFAGGVAATFAAIAGQALALAAALALETLLWIGFTAAFAAGSLFEGSTTPVVAASMLGLAAMGVQSASVRLLMRGVASTNVMTTNTSQIAIDATQLVWARLGGEGSADAMRLREICRRGCGAACLAFRFSGRNGGGRVRDRRRSGPAGASGRRRRIHPPGGTVLWDDADGGSGMTCGPRLQLRYPRPRRALLPRFIAKSSPP